MYMCVEEINWKEANENRGDPQGEGRGKEGNVRHCSKGRIAGCGYKERPKQVVGVKGSGGKKQIKQNICGNIIMKPTTLMLI